MSHSSIFGSLGGALIVMYRLVFRKFVHKLEVFGTGVSLIGCIVILLDAKAKKVEEQQLSVIVGDLIALIASVSGAFYFSLI